MNEPRSLTDIVLSFSETNSSSGVTTPSSGAQSPAHGYRRQPKALPFRSLAARTGRFRGQSSGRLGRGLVLDPYEESRIAKRMTRLRCRVATALVRQRARLGAAIETPCSKFLREVREQRKADEKRETQLWVGPMLNRNELDDLLPSDVSGRVLNIAVVRNARLRSGADFLFLFDLLVDRHPSKSDDEWEYPGRPPKSESALMGLIGQKMYFQHFEDRNAAEKIWHERFEELA